MGAFRLAKTNQVPIIPITIKGCANMLPKGTIWPKVTKVNITIHPKIVTTNLTPNEIMIEAREKISSKLIGS
jgi:1-acyl-sn-glycerol-3-phosphate acyltransferase